MLPQPCKDTESTHKVGLLFANSVMRFHVIFTNKWLILKLEHPRT